MVVGGEFAYLMIPGENLIRWKLQGCLTVRKCVTK